MLEQLLNWHLHKHPQYKLDNPASQSSQQQLSLLSDNLIIPIENTLGAVKITYGFTSPSLLSYIKKHNPTDMAPEIDQHAAMELNTRGNRICKRDGAACDILVEGYENKMDVVASYIVKNLAFDRLYFYGKSAPLHISIGPENSRYALIRTTRSDGLRVNRKSSKGRSSQTLFDHL